MCTWSTLETYLIFFTMHFKTFWGQKLKFPMAMEDQGHMGRGGWGGGKEPQWRWGYDCSDSVQAERKVNHKCSYSAQVVRSTNCWRVLKEAALIPCLHLYLHLWHTMELTFPSSVGRKSRRYHIIIQSKPCSSTQFTASLNFVEFWELPGHSWKEYFGHCLLKSLMYIFY